jgi:formyltetrahydrofolate hydrolase
VRDDDVARLIVACPDRHGIIASLSQYLSTIGANI